MPFLSSIFGWLGLSGSRQYGGGNGSRVYGNVAFPRSASNNENQRQHRANSAPELRRPSETRSGHSTSRSERKRRPSDTHLEAVFHKQLRDNAEMKQALNALLPEAERIVRSRYKEQARLQAEMRHAQMEKARKLEHDRYLAARELEKKRLMIREAEERKAGQVRARDLADKRAPIHPMQDDPRDEDDDEPGCDDSVSQVGSSHRYMHMEQGVRKGFEGLDGRVEEVRHNLRIEPVKVARSIMSGHTSHSAGTHNQPLRLMAPLIKKSVKQPNAGLSATTSSRVVHQLPWHPNQSAASKPSASSSTFSSQPPFLINSASSVSSKASVQTAGSRMPYVTRGPGGGKALVWQPGLGNKAMAPFGGSRIVEVQ